MWIFFSCLTAADTVEDDDDEDDDEKPLVKPKAAAADAAPADPDAATKETIKKSACFD